MRLVVSAGFLTYALLSQGATTATRTTDLSVESPTRHGRADHDRVHDPEYSGGACTFEGNPNYIPRFTSSSTIGDSSIQDDGITTTFTGSGDSENGIVEIRGASEGSTKQLFIKESDENHTAFEATNLVAFQEATFDTGDSPANAVAGDFEVTSTRVCGEHPLTNIALLASATGGDTNYSFYSTNGAMRNDGPAGFGATSVTSLTDTGPLTVAPEQMVSLGKNVEPFSVPSINGGGVTVGATQLLDGHQLAIKNTVGGGVTGLQVSLDTNVEAAATGGMTIYRGSGNGVEAGGLAVIGGPDRVAIGASTGDVVLYSYDPARAGRSIDLASGSGPTVRMKVDENGHLITRGAAPTISSCGDSPAITGTDVAGIIIMGAEARTCTITFAHAYGSEPPCVLTPMGTSTMPVYMVTDEAIVASEVLPNTKYHYQCWGL